MGMRFRKTPVGYLPSVTTIRDFTQSTRSKAALQKWSEKVKKETGKDGLQVARFRGSSVHRLREMYLASGGVVTPEMEEYILECGDMAEEVSNYFRPLTPRLDGWDRDLHMWCEKPFPYLLENYPEAKKCFCPSPNPEDNGLIVGQLWSLRNGKGFAGQPDDIGMYRGKGGEYRLTLSDLKTSKRLYCRDRPDKPHPSIYAEAKRNGPESFEEKWLKEYREKNSGYLSYWGCVLQLVAYKILVRDCLGLEVDCLQVMVATPGRSQKFTVTPEEEMKAFPQWEGKVRTFYEVHGSTLEEMNNKANLGNLDSGSLSIDSIAS